MAFSTTLIKWGFMAGRRWELHSFTNTAGDTGGNVTFGNLRRILIAWVTEQSAGTVLAGAVLNATFPLATNVVALVTQADSDGYIFAIGDPV